MISNEELLKEYKISDDERKQEIEGLLIEKNISLVYSYLRKSKIPPTEDVVQEGIIGLIVAIRNYNGKNKFSTYSYIWIKNKVLRHIRNNQMIKIPEYVKEDLKFNFCSIEKTSLEYEDIEEEQNIYKIIVNDFKKTLSDRESSILELYLKGLNYREISEKHNVCSQRVIQIMSGIKNKLKDFVGGNENEYGMEF